MSRTTAGRPRPLVVRAAFAAVLIAAMAAAPAVAVGAATHPANTTVSAEPNDGPAIPDPSGGSLSYSPQAGYYDDYYYVPDGGAGGGGGG